MRRASGRSNPSSATGHVGETQPAADVPGPLRAPGVSASGQAGNSWSPTASPAYSRRLRDAVPRWNSATRDQAVVQRRTRVVVNVLRRLSAVTLGVVVAGMLMVLAPGTASACSCGISPLADRVSAADVVFVGTPTKGVKPEGDAVSSADPVRWTFDVESVHKGDVTQTVDVISALDSASCGIPFEIDRPYLVFGVLNDETITAGLCGGTERLDQILAQDLASLGSSTSSAVQGSSGKNTSDPAATSSGSSSGLVLVGVALAAAAVLGLGVVVLRRRSHPDP